MPLCFCYFAVLMCCIWVCISFSHPGTYWTSWIFIGYGKFSFITFSFPMFYSLSLLPWWKSDDNWRLFNFKPLTWLFMPFNLSYFLSIVFWKFLFDLSSFLPNFSPSVSNLLLKLNFEFSVSIAIYIFFISGSSVSFFLKSASSRWLLFFHLLFVCLL